MKLNHVLFLNGAEAVIVESIPPSVIIQHQLNYILKVDCLC